MKFFLTLLLCITFSFAEKPVKEFFSKHFTPAELFAHLDAVGDNGNWINYDATSVTDASVKRILDKNSRWKAVFGQYTKGAHARLAVLYQEKESERLAIYDIEGFDANPIALEINKKLYIDAILTDFKGIAQNEFEHNEDPSLKIHLFENGMKFTYERPDVMPLRFDNGFNSKTDTEKKEIALEYLDFFKYEYSLMVRAFVQSTKEIFNWQAWHWYMPEWYLRYFITVDEIVSILSLHTPPKMISVFKAKTSAKVFIEMKTDGNGHYEMVVDNR